MSLPHLWFTKVQRRQLLLNGQRSAAGKDIDPSPVVKLFIPDGAATWLLTELDPSEPTRAFGLCDLGLGSPELGYVDLNELARLRGYLKLPVSRDIYFQPNRKLSGYAADAIAAGRITV
ncbi:DUF2958 domain-containing protein [Methylobacterium sp. WL8]|uniref:DUF2958 domain-containing protein n=1 Tax=Methylobacterium sp. WL8 TaxID=2603899 RepID=UPI001FEFA78E|nr:DUF2958 domain-containing protein [Methylobacterium sp. WL8]